MSKSAFSPETEIDPKNRDVVTQLPDGTFQVSGTRVSCGEAVKFTYKLEQATGDMYASSACRVIRNKRHDLLEPALEYLLKLAEAGPRDEAFNTLVERHNMWKAEKTKWDAMSHDDQNDYAIAMFADDPRTEPSLTEWRKTRQK